MSIGRPEKSEEAGGAQPTAGDESPAPGRSNFADALEQIKADTLAAAGKRTHLPQPLFWSLFHARLAELKTAKKAVRELEELFSPKL